MISQLVRVPPNRAQRGLTLTELVVASAIGLLILAAIGITDIARVRMAQDYRARSLLLAPGYLDTVMALGRIAKDLERADRINVISANPLNVQMRIPEMRGATSASCTSCPSDNTTPPEPCCFDQAGNYRWVQYAHVDTDGNAVSDTLRFFDDTSGSGNPCGNNMTNLATHLSSTRMAYADRGNHPAEGIEPFSAASPFANGDNNDLAYELVWDGGAGRTHQFHGETTLRPGAYTNLDATDAGDSGRGLDIGNVSPPPPPC